MLEEAAFPPSWHCTNSPPRETSRPVPLGTRTCFGRNPGSLLARAALICLLFPFSSACANVEAPVVEASPLEDTRDILGPYSVAARVLEHRGLTQVRLFFRDASEERAQIVPMEEVLPDRFVAGIPGMPPGTQVHWFVEAEDVYGNLGYATPTAEWGDESCVDWESGQGLPTPGSAYCFSVLPR